MNEYKELDMTLSALKNIAVDLNGEHIAPTRDEFFTNYPFFKYWKKENNEKLDEIPGINIYIHIPYCIQICDYCFYMKELVKTKSQVDEYVDYLCEEIKLVSDLYSLNNRTVNAIYFGGGTPSVLTEQQFTKIINTLKANHYITKPEVTFEAEPGTFSRSKLEMYKENGVNRISMGVQSFDDEIIKLSSRKHTVKQAINSIEIVNDVGGFATNIDLLSGLAGETMFSWNKSLQVALEQHVDMITIYKMKVYSNTVFFEKGVHKKEIKLPTESEELEFMRAALEKLDEVGYSRWSTFAFTRMKNHRHWYAENTWRGQDMIAYGASSFGKIGNINYQNLNNTSQYYEKIRAGKIPVYRSYALSYKDQIVKELLLCSARLGSYRKSEFINKFGFDYFDMIPDTISQLIEKGYIFDNKQELTLTQLGILFGDYIGKLLASSVKNKLGNDKIGFSY